ncbi:MAG: hypothetical protein AAF384_01340 [Pseudomonadota bacterium]
MSQSLSLEEVPSVRLRQPRSPLASPASPVAIDTRPRAAAYGIFSVAAVTLVIVTWAMSPDVPFSRALYGVALLEICIIPVFFLRAPQYRLLVLFMLWFFAMFGFSSLLGAIYSPSENTLIFIADQQALSGLINLGDLVVYVGAISAILGYYAVQKLMPSRSRFLAREWQLKALFWVAFAVWVPTTIISSAYFLSLKPGATPTHILGIPLNIASNIKTFPMMCSAIFIYLALMGYRRGLLWSILAGVIVLELFLGFFANTKEVSFRLIALIILGAFFIRGRVELKWIIVAVVLFVPYQMYFSVYRLEYLQIRDGTRLEALADIEATQAFLAEQAGKAVEKDERSVIESSLRKLSDRVNARAYIDIIVGRTGIDVGYQNGKTLMRAIYSFIPRAVWPNKPQIATGQLFNHEFGLSASKLTYVPASQLGEFYWNFGVLGVVVGMIGIGVGLGYVGRLQGLMTAPRFILLLMTAYFFVLRFEAGFGLQVGKMGRVMAILLVLHAVMNLFGRNRQNT